MGSQARLEAAAANELALLDRRIVKAADRILRVDDSLIPELEKRLQAMKKQREALGGNNHIAGTTEALAVG